MSRKNQPLANKYYSPEVLNSFHNNDEIDLRELLKALWDGKLIVIALTVLFSTIAFLYALYQPNIYQSDSSFVVNKRFYSSYSGPEFAPQFFSSNELKNSIFSYSNASASEMSGVNVSYDKRNRIVHVTKSGKDPENVFKGVSLMTSNMNNVLKLHELRKVDITIDALKKGVVPPASSIKAQDLIDELLVQHLFMKAILESPDSKLIQMIKEPRKPASSIKPKRVSFVVVGALLGGMLGIAITFIRFAFRREDD